MKGGGDRKNSSHTCHISLRTPLGLLRIMLGISVMLQINALRNLVLNIYTFIEIIVLILILLKSIYDFGINSSKLTEI